MTFQQAVEQAVSLLRAGQPVPWAVLANKAGVHKDKLRGKARRQFAGVAGPARQSTGMVETNFTEKTGEVEIKSKRIVTLDDLLTHCSVDLSLWRVERHVLNKWEVGAKDANGNIVVEPLYQVKAWLVKDDVVKHTEDAVNYLLSRVTPRNAAPAPKKSNSGKLQHLLEIAVPDLHIGKLVVSSNGTRTYDTATAVSRFKDAVVKLVERSMASGMEIGRIVFPVGNDLLHVDNGRNTTTAGTPQDVDGLWHEAYIAAEEAMVWAIDYLNNIAPVHVIIVPGNHDHEKMFTMGRVLAAYFKNDPDVTFDLSRIPRKYLMHGNSMIMFSHLNDEKASDIPLLMATEQPSMWASSVYREAHGGHWHSKMLTETKGVRVRIIPSLCDTDEWHSRKGYVGNIKSAEAFLWSPVEGVVGMFAANYNHE